MMFSESIVTNHSQRLKLSRKPSSARKEIHRYWTNVKMRMTSAYRSTRFRQTVFRLSSLPMSRAPEIM